MQDLRLQILHDESIRAMLKRMAFQIYETHFQAEEVFLLGGG